MFDPALAIKISADSVQQLRQTDVFRVIEWAPNEHREELGDYIRQHRPELAAEVTEVLAELS